jgi:hypothetical protein
MIQNYEGCDGVLWYVDEQEDKINVDATMYRYVDKSVGPDELGFKYHVLTFKNDDHNSTEVLTAYIGDVSHFVNVRASLGYNGLMVKDKSVPKKTIKQMFERVLTGCEFPGKIIKAVTKQI